MGALPKRRISTRRQGKRRAAINLESKQIKHHAVPNHKKGLLSKLKQVLGMHE